MLEFETMAKNMYAWDDEKGLFIAGYYIVGLRAQAFLLKQSGEKIVHDPLSARGEYRLGMKLQTIQIAVVVFDRHDFSDSVCRNDSQTRRDGIALCNQ